MEEHQSPVADKPAPRRHWNKGKQGRQRDLALFNLVIDSKLRSCDVVAIRVGDVAPSGYAMDRATIRQRKRRSTLAPSLLCLPPVGMWAPLAFSPILACR